AQLVAVELTEVADPHEHGGVAVPVRRREVDATRVGDEHLLDPEVGHAEGEDVVEALARLRIDGIRAPASMEAEHLPVHLVGRARVVDLLRRLGHGERELVQILHGRHAATLDAAAGCRSGRTGRSSSWGNPWFPHEPPPSAPATLSPAAGCRSGRTG